MTLSEAVREFLERFPDAEFAVHDGWLPLSRLGEWIGAACMDWEVWIANTPHPRQDGWTVVAVFATDLDDYLALFIAHRPVRN